MNCSVICMYGLSWWFIETPQCRRHGFNPWIGKIPWRRKWQPTQIFLPAKPHGQRSLVGCSPQDHKWVRHDLRTKQQQQRAMNHVVECAAIFGWIIFSVCCLHAHLMSLFCFKCSTLNIVHHIFKCNSSFASKLWKLLLLFSCQIVSDSMTPWTAAGQASLSLSFSWNESYPSANDTYVFCFYWILYDLELVNLFSRGWILLKI